MMLILYMALCGGYSGGSLPYSHVLDREIVVFGKRINFTWLPEMMFSFGFAGYASYTSFSFLSDYLVPYAVPWLVAAVAYAVAIWIFLRVAIWSYLWMQSATAPALHWGQGGYNPKRTSTLKPFVDWINKKTIKADPSTVQYCRLYMGVKWFLIGLPTGFGAIMTAIIAVAAYEARVRFNTPHWVAECGSAAGAGLAILFAYHGVSLRGFNE